MMPRFAAESSGEMIKVKKAEEINAGFGVEGVSDEAHFEGLPVGNSVLIFFDLEFLAFTAERFDSDVD